MRRYSKTVGESALTMRYSPRVLSLSRIEANRPYLSDETTVARNLEITDWEKEAVARDKTQYFEIHVQRCEVAILSILSLIQRLVRA